MGNETVREKSSVVNFPPKSSRNDASFHILYQDFLFLSELCTVRAKHQTTGLIYPYWNDYSSSYFYEEVSEADNKIAYCSCTCCTVFLRVNPRKKNLIHTGQTFLSQNLNLTFQLFMIQLAENTKYRGSIPPSIAHKVLKYFYFIIFLALICSWYLSTKHRALAMLFTKMMYTPIMQIKKERKLFHNATSGMQNEFQENALQSSCSAGRWPLRRNLLCFKCDKMLSRGAVSVKVKNPTKKKKSCL